MSTLRTLRRTNKGGLASEVDSPKPTKPIQTDYTLQTQRPYTDNRSQITTGKQSQTYTKGYSNRDHKRMPII